MSKKNKTEPDIWKIPSDYCIADPEVARRLGINEALVLRTLYNLGRYKKHQYGTEWFQGSRNFWLIKFAWLSESTLRRIFLRLIEEKLLEVNTDHKAGNWFRINEKQLETFLSGSVQNEPTDDSGSGQNEPTSPVNLNGESGQNEPTLLNRSLIQPISIPYVSSAPASEPEIIGYPETFEQKKTQKEKTSGALVFAAYRDAYLQRYRVEPLRNAKVNTICAQMAKQLPIEEAQAVIHFYLRQNVSWYVQKGHAIEYALKDLQALRTNMLKNKTMSSTAANQLDKIAANKSALEESINGEDKSSFNFSGDFCEPINHKATLGLLRESIEKPK